MTAWKQVLLAVTVGVGLSAASGSAAASQAMGMGWRPSLCEVELDLVGMVYVVEDPDRSFALVGSPQGRLVRIGSFVAGREVLEMEPTSLWLGPAEDPCLLRLSHEGKQRVTPKRKPGRRKRKSKRR